MKQPDDIQKEVEQTLNSLDGLERAKPRPFFHTRVEARLEASQQQSLSPILAWFQQARVQWAMIACLLMLNVGVILLRSGSSPDTIADRDGWLEYMAEEYALNSTDLYSLQPSQP